MIDPDCIQLATIEATGLSEMYRGDLYMAESGWFMSNVDWKQLGHLIVHVDVIGVSVEDATKQDEFIKTLINTGIITFFVCILPLNLTF